MQHLTYDLRGMKHLTISFIIIDLVIILMNHAISLTHLIPD